ncbi:MAG: helix-turn-helix domain containing protein [Gammaproteobacteria bacterium]|nr:helix-turn-helix domain containing protein [Gammaproteobacteria bacterium]
MNESTAVLELKKKAKKQLLKISDEASIHSNRAKALLLLSEGASQEEAAEKTTLSLGQVRYWLGRYRANGIACFPEVIEVESKPNNKSKKSDSKKTKKTDKKIKVKKTDKKKDKAKKIKKSKSKK